MPPQSDLKARLNLIEIIVADDDALRNQALDNICSGLGRDELLNACVELEAFRKTTDNLYYRVRALFFLYAIHRFHLPRELAGLECGRIPLEGNQCLLQRRFQEAIRSFLLAMEEEGPSIALTSALAEAYHRLAFQTLADQVRKSVRTVTGNRWMFRVGHPDDHPLQLQHELFRKHADGSYCILREQTSVRMDFSHAGWSDIFFLGMDFPEGARVINASIDLAVRGKHASPEPPIETALRVIDEPVLRLTSIDLKATADLTSIVEVFDFARDYLGLLKAAVIASGIVPPGMEGCDLGIEKVLNRLVGPQRGIEIVSRVNDIPKGSRLAVSTNLLGSLIALCMRATGQVTQLTGPLEENDRRIVAARAILGEWLGGSGGGWQDSGGVWPGIKLITGSRAQEGDPEAGISRGRLLPTHHVFSDKEISPATRAKLQESLVLVHGGMAQNVGPVLEMVTEKYLLRSESEWKARQEAIGLLDQIADALQSGDIRKLGTLTQQNFSEPLQAIIPWCSNRYTESLIEQCQTKYAEQFWGFWMLGGMAGGGMGFIFAPEIKEEAASWLAEKMLVTKREMATRLPFAMDPVVYDFEINPHGTVATWEEPGGMPRGYYEMVIPDLLRVDRQNLSPARRAELQLVDRLCREPSSEADRKLATRLIGQMLPGEIESDESSTPLDELLDQNGFDPQAHAQLQEDIRVGRLGLPQNRLPASTSIEDVLPEDVIDARANVPSSLRQAADRALAAGEVAVMTLAAGVGSRWTEGAGVVKALHPFCKIQGRHRSFLEVHLAKSRQLGKQYGHYPTHIISTGYLTDAPIRQGLEACRYEGNAVVSPGKSVGLRLIPTERDLRFAWEDMPQQALDEQQEKVRRSARAALLGWAKSEGEASDYRDNEPYQCLHPVGHWYEVPNLLRNGTLARLLEQQPQLRFLMLHNVDTLGATLDPGVLALHMTSGACLSFEVISRRLEDRGGGLARVNGVPRLVEGLALPDERDEFKLSYYNSMTTWIDIDRLLEVFGLNRGLLRDATQVNQAIRVLARRLPTYITLKDVKKRWGHGHEDIFPVSQFEKLWGDMTGLPEVDCQYIVVSTDRGQQLKEQSQLDGWLRDGSARYVESLCHW